jgi:hypothetical protein
VALISPYPQWPEGVVEEGFDELAKRSMPILNDFDAHGVNVCCEIGVTTRSVQNCTLSSMWQARGANITTRAQAN